MKLKLDKTYYYGRRSYGPGDAVEVPDEVGEFLRSKLGKKAAAAESEGDAQAASKKSATKGGKK